MTGRSTVKNSSAITERGHSLGENERVRMNTTRRGRREKQSGGEHKMGLRDAGGGGGWLNAVAGRMPRHTFAYILQRLFAMLRGIGTLRCPQFLDKAVVLIATQGP